MDGRLVGWARAVKSRQRWAKAGAAPVLWLFTDPARSGNLLTAVRSLPAGLCGVVFRHDGAPGRAALARAVWRVCRERRLAMVIAGNGLGLAGPGRHLRGGRGRGAVGGSPGLRTASAHGAADLVRARRMGVDLAFLSPVFATASHPGADGMGVVRWSRLARGAGVRVLALGGIDGARVRRLPVWAPGAGAIGALSP